MADKDLTYRLVIRDDGTPILRKIAIEAEKTGASVTAATAKAVSTPKVVPFQMAPQMQANAAFWMDPAVKAQEEGMKKVTGEIKTQVAEATNLERIMERIQRTMAAFVAVWAFQKVVQGFSSMISIGIEYNATLEQSRLGMAAILTAQGQFTDSSGRALQGTEALNAAMEMSSDITKKLQMDNLQTAATYQQLVKAYQQTIAPGLAVGFDPNQIRQYTLAMVQAASAMGLNLDMLAEETRSMLRGAITPRNTLIATALGLRNEDIRKYKNDAEGLYKFIMGRLSAFGVAGDMAQKTWAGVTSNVKDAISMVLGESFKPMFNYLKSEMTNIQNSLVTWTAEGPKLNEAVVSGFREVSDLMVNMLKLSKEIANTLALPTTSLSVLIKSINFMLEKWTQVLSFISKPVAAYKNVVEGLSSAIKNKMDFSKKTKELSGSEDMPFGDISYDVKYVANRMELDKIDREIAEQVAKINLQIATQNKNYKEQIYLVDILTKAEIEKAQAEGKFNLELENALKNQGEQRKKHLLIQQEMERLGWGGETSSIKAQMAEMVGDIQEQVNWERQSLNITIERNRAGLGVRDSLQKQSEEAKKLKFEIGAVRRIELDRLNYESKITTLQSSVSQVTGDYEAQANLVMEIYQKKMDILAAEGKISVIRLNEISKLEAVLALYAKEDILAKGILSHYTTKWELESRLAIATDNTAKSLDIQQMQASLVTQELERILERARKITEPNEKYIKQLEDILGITKQTNAEEDKRRRLESSFSQTGRSLGYQSDIANMSGNWEASKTIEKELLKLELDRALAIEGLSAKGKEYANISYQMKTAEAEAQRTLNQSQLEEIGMKQYAFKLNQDLVNQYSNKIPNAIDLSVNAFGTFLESIGSGTKSIGDNFRALFADIGKGILKLLIEIQMAELKLAIMKSLGFVDSSIISAIVSPAAGAVPLAGTRAGGGPVSAGYSYLVGERGKPEIFTPSVSGNISPVGGTQNIKVQIINESGVPVQAKSAKVDVRPDEYIISVVIDAAARNRMGFRDMMGGG